jgi:hypothetical protein
MTQQFFTEIKYYNNVLYLRPNVVRYLFALFRMGEAEAARAALRVRGRQTKCIVATLVTPLAFNVCLLRIQLNKITTSLYTTAYKRHRYHDTNNRFTLVAHVPCTGTACWHHTDTLLTHRTSRDQYHRGCNHTACRMGNPTDQTDTRYTVSRQSLICTSSDPK